VKSGMLQMLRRWPRGLFFFLRRDFFHGEGSGLCDDRRGSSMRVAEDYMDARSGHHGKPHLGRRESGNREEAICNLEPGGWKQQIVSKFGEIVEMGGLFAVCC
jgi:hypothetical protein